MHAYSNTEFQNLIPVITSNVSSNRIKIQEILLILQLETDYFSKSFISEMLHSKQWHYSLHRDFQNCYSTRRSLTRFFSSNPTRAHYSTIQRILHPEFILHAEGKELFEYYSPVSRNSTHRRQGDLLEMHPCVLHDIPGNSSCSRDIPDIPVIHDLPAFQAILQCSSISRESTHSSILWLECLFYNSTVRLVSTENSTEYQLGNYRHYIHSPKKGRCCDIGQIDRFSIIELFPLSSCQMIILIARMTFNCFSSCLMS